MKRFVILLSSLMVTVSYAQLDRSERPEPAEAPTINIKDSEVFKLDNGLTVILSENHKLPRVTFSLRMGSDPMLKGDLIGVGDLTGDLLSSGTEHRSKDELDNEVDYIGASLRTGSGYIYLSCLTKHMNKGLELMSDVLQYSNFPQDEIDRIKKQYQDNLESTESDANAMLSNAIKKVNFPSSHPMSEVMTPETLNNIDRNAILAYYKKEFTPQGGYLVIVGDINKENAEKLAEDYFGTWRGNEKFEMDYGKSPKNNGNRVIFINKPGAVQSVISVTFPVDMTIDHPDYLKLVVLNNILGGGGFQNRLMQNLREDKGFTYGCRSSLTITDHDSWFSTSGSFRNEVTDSAITELLYEVDRITNEYVTAEELAITKSSMNGSFARSLESPSTIANFAFNIIDHKLPADFYQTYLKRLDAVTIEDVLDVAQKYFTPRNCNIVVVGNEEVIPMIEQFDADGTIEKLDAFGSEVKELQAADISAEQLFENYLLKVTMSTNTKKMNKKFKKMKCVKRDIELSSAMGTLLYSEAYGINGEVGKMLSMSGNALFKNYYDAQSGSSFSQMGKEDYSEDELKAAQKTTGFFPERNYAEQGMIVSMEGIENISGTDYYVVKLDDGEMVVYEYFTKDCLKHKRREIYSGEGQTVEFVFEYSNYQEDSGFYLPVNIDITLMGMPFDGKVKSVLMSNEIDFGPYK